MAKNRKDWAIVVGVQTYPHESFGTPLKAPENDAKAIRDWLLSEQGGKLLKSHVTTILSSDYRQPFRDALSAKPTAERIGRAFLRLDAVAEENMRKGLGRKVGRRLYLYFAGHGCAPNNPSQTEALLLAANATDIHLGANIPGKMYAEWYSYSGYFEEIVLLMDCCRDVLSAAPVNVPANKLVVRQEALDTRKFFFGFATKWSRKAREKPFNGNWQGVFTTALLTGLRGGAADPEDGRITAASLRNYLYNSWREFLSPDDLADPEVPQEPDLEVSPSGADELVFAQIPVPTFPVTINFSENIQGGRVHIFDTTFQVVESTGASPSAWKVNLRKGKYLVVSDTGAFDPKQFDVLGTGAAHVTV
jgi:uncharacterized caspase-like protein